MDEEPVATSRQASRGRRISVIVLAVLTCLSLLVTTVGVWAHYTLLNTNGWVNAVGPLAKDPAVIDAMAVTLTDQISSAVDLQSRAEAVLPAKAKPIAGAIATGMHQFVEQAIVKLLNTDQFQKFWVTANRLVHQTAVKVLRGDTKLVKTTNGVVQLDLLPLVAKALTFVNSKAPGIFGLVKDKQIPNITFDTPIDQARSELSAALGRPLPANFGVITVFDSHKLRAAQDLVALFDRLVIGLVIGTLLLLTATIVLAVDRRRILIGLGIGTIVVIGLAIAITNALKKQVVQLISPASRAAASATINRVVSNLRVASRVMLVLAALVVIVAVLSGDSRPAKRIRSSAKRAVAYSSGRIGAEQAPAWLRWVHDHARVLQWVGLGLALAAVVFTTTSWSTLLLIVVLLALYEGAVTYAGTRGRPAVA